jgi:putative nucleotidyltransferase with HDIG domain
LIVSVNQTKDELKAKFLEDLKELPTLPTVVAQLLMTMNEPTSSARDLERLIANDQSIAARLLKLANSAFYGLPGKVTSLSRTITLLGFNTVRSLVLTIGVVDKFSGESGGRYFDRGEFWEHSLSVAMASKLLCAKDPSMNQEEAHIAGLLHDIGKIVMDNQAPQKFQKAMQEVLANGMDVLEAEREHVGLSHDEAGALVAEQWRFPEFIQVVVKHHHDPDKATQHSDMAHLVAMANEIVRAMKKQEKENLDYQLPEVRNDWQSRWLPDPRHEELFITKYEVEIERVRDILSLYI